MKKTSFPRAILSFISSSIVLSVLTVDPRYLNDLTCSNSLLSIFMGFGWEEDHVFVEKCSRLCISYN